MAEFEVWIFPLSRAAWDGIAAFAWSFEFARVAPLVSRGFAAAIESAPVWASEWAALKAKRASLLKYASGSAWDYDLDDVVVRNPRPRRKKGTKKAKVASSFKQVVAETRALFDDDFVDDDDDETSDDDVADLDGSEDEGETPRRENVIIPSPGYAREPRPWRWTGCGVREEAGRSNAVLGVHDEEEDPSPRASLARSQEAAYFFRLQRALRDWAAEEEEASSRRRSSSLKTKKKKKKEDKAETILAIAAKLRCRSFVTCEGVSEDGEDEEEELEEEEESSACRRRPRETYGGYVYGSKSHAIAVVEVGSVTIRVFCVPRLVIETPEASALYESFVVAFKARDDNVWKYPVDFDTAAGRLIDDDDRNQRTIARTSNSQVFRLDLLSALAEAVARATTSTTARLSSADALRLAFLVAGVQPAFRGVFDGPRYFLAWTDALRAVKNGDYDYDAGVVYGTLQEALFGAAFRRWRDVVAGEPPDLGPFASLLVFDALADDLRHTWGARDDDDATQRTRGILQQQRRRRQRLLQQQQQQRKVTTTTPKYDDDDHHLGENDDDDDDLEETPDDDHPEPPPADTEREESSAASSRRGGLASRLGSLLFRPLTFWREPKVDDDLRRKASDSFDCDVPPRLARHLLAKRRQE